MTSRPDIAAIRERANPANTGGWTGGTDIPALCDYVEAVEKSLTAPLPEEISHERCCLIIDSLPQSASKFDYIRAGYAEASRSLRAEMKEAVEDKARLDFLDECNRRLNAQYGTTYRWRMIMNHNVNRLFFGDLTVDLRDSDAHGLPSCRDAIDAERQRIATRSKDG